MIEQLRVQPGLRASLTTRDTRETFGLHKAAGKAKRKELVERLSVLQQRLYAEHERSLLLVLQGLDASGKDGVIRQVFTGLNPQGCRAVSFKAPTSTELAHDFLWRIHAALPELVRSASSTAPTTRTSSPCGCSASCPRMSGRGARAT